MKAVVKNDTNVGLAYLDVPKPEPKPNEVLIRVHAASICGTDIHYYKWNSRQKILQENLMCSFHLLSDMNVQEKSLQWEVT